MVPKVPPRDRKTPPTRERLDRVLVMRDLAPSREQAARLILAGLVRVEGARVDKQAALVPVDASIELAEQAMPFVSRAGGKLAAALDRFALNPAGLVALDVGASTGGFTDCLLQRGVKKVYAVDVGYGQLDWRLRQDSRVVTIERTNIRYLDPATIADAIDLAVVDVSFISLTTVLPCVVRFLSPEAWVVALVKPQFEVGKGRVGRGGIVRDDGMRRESVDKVVASARALGLEETGEMDSPVHGQKGNREVLVAFRRAARTLTGGRE